MKTIVWTGPERIIPGYGMGSEGIEVTLPDEMADSYIEQGLAKIPSSRKKEVKLEEKD